ncbi:MAG: hypothetical protein Q8N55_04625 [bacterium]|nr:hypothetical protein [bacterium]
MNFKLLWQKHSRLITLGAIVFFCSFLLLQPTSYAHASVVGKIFGFFGDTINTLVLNIVRGGLGLISMLVYGLMRLSHYILIWVLGNPLPDGLSLTNPATNPILNVGWTTLRDFTNMLFILGLAYIGLMTALDLNNFDVKKTFKNLLLVALLINFTPVMCGAIVDGSNIIANFFLNGVSFDSVLNVIESKWSFEGMFSFDFEQGVSQLMNLVGIILFGLVLTVVFFLYALLLLVRIIMIWFLVILSPIAFFAWIFDSSKKYFKMWWDLFIKWATIIVPAGFFLYLSTHVFSQADQLFETQYQSGGDVDFSFFASITPMLMGCGFAIVGFLATLKINAMGSKSIIGVATKASNSVRTKGAAALKKMPYGSLAGATGGTASAVARYKLASAAGKGGFGKLGAGIAGFVAGAGTKAGREWGKRKIEEGVLEKAIPPLKGSYEGRRAKRMDTSKTEARYENLSDAELHKIAAKSPFGPSKAAALKVLSTRKRLTEDEEKQLKKQPQVYETLGIKPDKILEAMSEEGKRNLLNSPEKSKDLDLQVKILQSLADKNRLNKQDEEFILSNLAQFDKQGMSINPLLKSLSSETLQRILQSDQETENHERQVGILETLSEQNRLSPESERILSENITTYEGLGVKVDKLLKGLSEKTKHEIYPKLQSAEEQFKILDTLRKDKDLSSEKGDIKFLQDNAEKFYNLGISLKDFAKALPNLEPYLNIAKIDEKISQDTLDNIKRTSPNLTDAEIKIKAREEIREKEGEEMIKKRFDSLTDEEIKKDLYVGALEVFPYLEERHIDVLAKASMKQRIAFDKMLQKYRTQIYADIRMLENGTDKEKTEAQRRINLIQNKIASNEKFIFEIEDIKKGKKQTNEDEEEEEYAAREEEAGAESATEA